MQVLTVGTVQPSSRATVTGFAPMAYRDRILTSEGVRCSVTKSPSVSRVDAQSRPALGIPSRAAVAASISSPSGADLRTMARTPAAMASRTSTRSSPEV